MSLRDEAIQAMTKAGLRWAVARVRRWEELASEPIPEDDRPLVTDFLGTVDCNAAVLDGLLAWLRESGDREVPEIAFWEKARLIDLDEVKVSNLPDLLSEDSDES